MIFDDPMEESCLDKRELFGENKCYEIYWLPQGTLSTAFGMYMRGDTLTNIGKSLLAGNGIRKTARLLGVSKCTVSKFYHILKKEVLSGEDILCDCGQWIGHQGWCSYRYKESQSRQRFMDKWHKKSNKSFVRIG